MRRKQMEQPQNQGTIDPLTQEFIDRTNKEIEKVDKQLGEYKALLDRRDQLQNTLRRLLGKDIPKKGKKGKSPEGAKATAKGQEERWALVDVYQEIHPELTGRRDAEKKMNTEFDKFKKTNPEATKESFVESLKKRK
jgi:hypothetical protein